MPRYFFDVQGRATVIDAIGQDCPGVSEARLAALKYLSSILSTRPRSGADEAMCIAVRDAQSASVATVTFEAR